MALVHAKAGEKVHLPTSAQMNSGSKTAALVKTDRFEAVHLLLKRDTSISPHAVPGYATIHCLEGSVSLGLERGAATLETGDWVYLARGESHSVQATQDSSLLVTILFD